MAGRQTGSPGPTGPDSGQPGGGVGRVDEVKGSPVYPGSGPYPSGDAAVRTPGSFAHGQTDEHGRPVEGGSEISKAPGGAVLGGDTPPSSSPPTGHGSDGGRRE